MFPAYTYPTAQSFDVDSPYLRAIADERASRAQYAAAQRAQREARDRAERARRAQLRLGQTFPVPYSSYIEPADADTDDDYYSGFLPSVDPRERLYLEALKERERAAREEAERRQRQAALELEERRRRQQMEMMARQREREQEAEQRRLALEEQERRRRRRSQRLADDDDELEQFYRSLALPVPQAPVGRREEERRTDPPTARSRTQPPNDRTPVRPRGQTPEPIRKSASTASKPSYTPDQITAAEKIQAFYRINITRRRALAALSSLSDRFAALSAGFTLPPTLDYIVAEHPTPVPTAGVPLPPPAASLDEDADATADVPRLAFTPANVPLRAYEEDLLRLLGKLDAIESGGDARVRERRRKLARRIEGEATRLERWKVAVWRAGVRREEEKRREKMRSAEDTTMDVSMPGTPDDAQRYSTPPTPAHVDTQPIHTDMDTGAVAASGSACVPLPPAPAPTPLMAPVPAPQAALVGTDAAAGTTSTAADVLVDSLSARAPAADGRAPAELLGAHASAGAALSTRPAAHADVDPGLLAPHLHLANPSPARALNADVPVSAAVQREVDAALGAREVAEEREVHRGFGAEIQNVPRHGDGDAGADGEAVGARRCEDEEETWSGGLEAAVAPGAWGVESGERERPESAMNVDGVADGKSARTTDVENGDSAML